MKENDKKESRQKSIRLNTTVIDNIEKLAKLENRTFTNMVETILMQATQNHTMNRA